MTDTEQLDDGRLLRIEDVMKLLHITRSQVIRLTRSGALSASNISLPGTKAVRLRYLVSSVMDFVKSRQVVKDGRLARYNEEQLKSIKMSCVRNVTERQALMDVLDALSDLDHQVHEVTLRVRGIAKRAGCTLTKWDHASCVASNVAAGTG